MDIHSALSRVALQSVHTKDVGPVGLLCAFTPEQREAANKAIEALLKSYSQSDLLQPIAEAINEQHPEFDASQKVLAVFRKVYHYFIEFHNERMNKIFMQNEDHLLTEQVLSKLLSEYEDQRWTMSYGYEPRTENFMPRKPAARRI